MSEIAMEENRKAEIRKMFGIRGARDKPRDSYRCTGHQNPDTLIVFLFHKSIAHNKYLLNGIPLSISIF